ncbi:hypothetical protein MHH52_07510 [Paenibacillus sp. FSL K6-0276]|uniref:hypothetical protein n=1 Tax=Paenibacillus sp. FSL K6-0276 TaxID=2921450 RepID=UPI0030EE34EA
MTLSDRYRTQLTLNAALCDISNANGLSPLAAWDDGYTVEATSQQAKQRQRFSVTGESLSFV